MLFKRTVLVQHKAGVQVESSANKVISMKSLFHQLLKEGKKSSQLGLTGGRGNGVC